MVVFCIFSGSFCISVDVLWSFCVSLLFVDMLHLVQAISQFVVFSDRFVSLRCFFISFRICFMSFCGGLVTRPHSKMLQ